MNNNKRNILSKAISKIEEAKTIIEFVGDGEQDSLDNIPDNLIGSERYENMEDVIDLLSESIDNLDEAISCVERAKE